MRLTTGAQQGGAVLCLGCRKRLPAGARFCAYCGAPQPLPPTPLPPVMFSASALRLASLGMLLGAPAGVGFWFLAGWLAGLQSGSRVVLGLLAGLLGGALGGLFAEAILWPVGARPAHAGDGWRLGAVYGAGGGLSLVAGGALIGFLVVSMGWGMPYPTMRALIAGALAGTISLAVGVPVGLLAGMTVGVVLALAAGRLGGKPGVAMSAALAWSLSASAGGALIGGLLAGRAGLDPFAGALLGGAIQTLVGGLLFPIAVRLARRLFILYPLRP